jgi:hypothetical protein
MVSGLKVVVIECSFAEISPPTLLEDVIRSLGSAFGKVACDKLSVKALAKKRKEIGRIEKRSFPPVGVIGKKKDGPKKVVKITTSRAKDKVEKKNKDGSNEDKNIKKTRK